VRIEHRQVLDDDAVVIAAPAAAAVAKSALSPVNVAV
jgi:hypothetical protein